MLKIDCEGCEWISYEGWLNQTTFVAEQILVEVSTPFNGRLSIMALAQDCIGRRALSGVPSSSRSGTECVIALSRPGTEFVISLDRPGTECDFSTAGASSVLDQQSNDREF